MTQTLNLTTQLHFLISMKLRILIKYCQAPGPLLGPGQGPGQGPFQGPCQGPKASHA